LRSAIVAYPVALTNSANSALVTSVRVLRLPSV